ncbi:hypothetical protein BDR07DRAFT_482597 [Suillus spraguei]|nr:hypothetical protein BDR07DRAFT_482597 [Suillus spraguei]
MLYCLYGVPWLVPKSCTSTVLHAIAERCGPLRVVFSTRNFRATSPTGCRGTFNRRLMSVTLMPSSPCRYVPTIPPVRQLSCTCQVTKLPIWGLELSYQKVLMR